MKVEEVWKFTSDEMNLICLLQGRAMSIKEIQKWTGLPYHQTYYLLEKNRRLLDIHKTPKRNIVQLKREVFESYLKIDSNAKENIDQWNMFFLRQLYQQSSSSMKTFLEHKSDDLFYCFSYYEILFIYYTLDIISLEQYHMYLGNFKFSVKHCQALFLKVMYFYHDVFSSLQILIVSSFCQQYLKDFQEFFSTSELKTLFFLLRYKTDGFDETIDLNELLLKFIVFVEDVFMPRNQQNTLT